MSKPVKYVRKIVYGIVGVTLVIIGAALLVLPGPGLLVIFAGLFVLSLEFEWAKPHVEKLRGKMQAVTNKARGQKTPKKPENE